MNFKILHGTNANLPSSKTAGNIYVTDDKGQLFIDISSDTRIQISDLILVTTLPSSPISGKLYFNTLDNLFYIYNNSWICLNDNELTLESILDVLQLGTGLKIDEANKLAVDAINSAEEGNMQPITSNAVYEILGTVESQLADI